MSVVIAVAAALGLVGLGMLVSPEMARLRKRRRQRKQEKAPPPLRAVSTEPLRAVPTEPLHALPSEPPDRPALHVIHGDGGTVVPFRPRRAEAFTSTSPHGPGGNGPDAA